jgi:hypothetical protein
MNLSDLEILRPNDSRDIGTFVCPASAAEKKPSHRGKLSETAWPSASQGGARVWVMTGMVWVFMVMV